MVGGLSNSVISQLVSQQPKPCAQPQSEPAVEFSAKNGSQSATVTSQPTSRYSPSVDATGAAPRSVESSAETSIGRMFDNVRRPETARQQAFELMNSRRSELERQIETCTNPEQREILKNQLADWDANAGLMGVMRQMHETSLSMELAAKAIETGNAGIKQVSQTQT